MERKSINHLNKWIKSKKRKPLVLRGARQVGKSTLVRLFAERQGLKLWEVNLEKNPQLDKAFKTLDLDLILSTLADFFKAAFKPQLGLLFLDEVQAAPHAIAALRYFYEERPDIPVIAAGSLLEFVLADHDFTMPVGRVEYMFLQPMDFEEFLEATNEEWALDRIHGFNWQKSFSEEAQKKLYELYRTYLMVGGMPEAVETYRTDYSLSEAGQVLENIRLTYQDDFAKYARKTELVRLQEVYDRLPGQIGQKIKYAEIIPGERTTSVRGCIDLLAKAQVLRLAFHSDCNRIPIGSQADRGIFKSFWLDVGLLNRSLGLPYTLGEKTAPFAHEGPLAEQFVAQHLHHLADPNALFQLYYWLREGRKGNAEVDFVIQHQAQIIPIEVKSAKSGSLKSLMQFVAARKATLAIQICADLPSLQAVTHHIVTPTGAKRINFKLLRLPPYLMTELPRLLEEI